jgi:hypothetical protein
MASYLFGVPVILWVFIVLALALACLLVCGRRKIPDFSKESGPLIVTPVAAVEAAAGPDEELADESTPLPTKVDYNSTTITTDVAKTHSLERQVTNPAGLLAKPQYNPTGIDNWVFGGGRRKNQQG